MNSQNGPPLANRVLQAVLILIVVAIGTRVAWDLLAPMLGWLMVVAVLIGIYLLILRRFRGW